jgi:menaquinone-9 beta-reductase
VDWNIQQHTPASLPDEVWDVGVIGAGPAGAMCALTLARAGHRCLLIDQARLPRHKACGDLLLADAQGALDQVGLLSSVRHHALAFDTIQVHSPSGIDFQVSGQFLALRRYDLDALVVQAALDSGALCLHAAVRDVANQPEQAVVELTPSQRRIGVRFAVLATGAVVALPGRLGMISRVAPDAMAIRCYVHSEAHLDDMILSYDKTLVPGYGWIVPIGGQAYNVGCGVTLDGGAHPKIDLKSMLRRFLGDFSPARELMRSGQYLSPIRGAALRWGLTGFRRCSVGRVLAVGEVAGTTFPFTGAGVGKAMASGLLAAQVLDSALRTGADDLGTEFETRLNRDIRPAYAGYTAAQRWLSRPWVNDLVARRIRRSTYLQREAAALLAASGGDPRGLFSIRSMLKSCWS